MNKNSPIYIIDDKLIDLVLSKWRISPLAVGALSSMLPLLFFCVLALVFREFESHDNKIGYLDDYTLFVNFIFGVSPVVAFYFLMPGYIQQCFEGLMENKVFTSCKTTNNLPPKYYKFVDFLQAVRRSLSSKLWVVIGVVLSSIFMLIVFPEHLRAKHWIVKHQLSFMAMELTWWIFFSFTIILIVRGLVGIWWINQSFKNFHVVVRPLYPDKVGGLRPLSQFSLRLGYIIFFFGLALGFNQYFTGQKMTGVLGQVAWSFDILVVWVVYIVLAPLAFFAPISAAHDAMKSAKDAEALLISSYFEKEYKLLRDNYSKPIESLKKHSSKIEEFQKMYTMVDAFPVWPFQLQKFVQFFLTILSPLILTVLSSVITSWLVNLR